MQTGLFRIVLVLALVVAVVALGRLAFTTPQSARGASSEQRPEKAASTVAYDGDWREFKGLPDLQQKLDPLQYRVTQKDGTEPPFRNRYWDHHDAGIYVDVVSGEPLFSSLDKFESGTGWPSFTRPLVAEQVAEHEDRNLGMRRVELRSKLADSHLGHVFDDGPAPTGLRYCINSAALVFIPAADLEAKGYGEFAALFKKDDIVTSSGKTETATLAGGCFWGMEDILRDIPGVLDTEVGYTGGHVAGATYTDVKTGESGHAESIQIQFDPDVISYEDILGFFFRMHDPTTKNRQGNDRGAQYRSAIFYHDKKQQETATRIKASVDASEKWKNPIVTEIVAAGEFFRAEEFHQDYLEKHPGGYTCHFLRD